MKIEKYKYLGNGKYKVIINKNDYIIYEDIILKYSLLTKELITEKELESFLKDNKYYEAYYKALKYINLKLRTKKEISKYLSKEFEKHDIEKVINKLQQEGYLNEDIYAQAYITDQINLKIIGPKKIIKDLANLGIPEETSKKYIDSFTKEEQYNKINKVIEKEIRLNSTKSSYMLKNKVLNNLIEKGFYKEDIEECIANYTFDDSKIYEKEYKKVYEKLSKKYKGTALEYKVKEKMYQKGFRTN